jgi:UDP-N-acetyl-D-mannosaminuronic acid dehydrogenase
MDKTCIVGLGYIGLPTAAMLAGSGCQVVGLDINSEVVSKINAGVAHIVEPDLDLLVQQVVESKYLQAKTKLDSEDTDIHVYVIAVPTPLTNDKKPDTSYVYSAVETISSAIKKGDLIILESTSPVGTTSGIAQYLQKLRPDLLVPVEDSSDNFDIHIAYCPERVLPGKILHEIIHNDRIIGGLTPACAERAVRFYRSFVKGSCVKTRARVAAMCKLTENSYRDVNIAFANELSMICDDLDIDITELRELANRHPRVNVLKDGPGVGGHCIAVDPWFIVDTAPDKSKLIRAAREINDFKPHYLVKQVERKLSNIESPVVLCLGLAYKPNIDDLRESPAVEVLRLLARNKGYRLEVVEPHISALPAELDKMDNVQLVSIENSREKNYDFSLKLVEHDAFVESAGEPVL